MKKRRHKNTSRLTAKGRARAIVTTVPLTPGQLNDLVIDIQAACEHHAAAALARHRRRVDR